MTDQTGSVPGQITLTRDELAALLAHHADVLATSLRADARTGLPEHRTGVKRAAGLLDLHANHLTAQEETPAVAELLDSTLSFTAEQPPGIRDAARQAAGQTTTVEPARDCPACDAGIEHTEHCPTPETHNWGCGCPTDRRPAVDRLRLAATQWRHAYREGDLSVAWDEAAVTVLALIENPTVTWTDLGFTRPAITGHAVIQPAVEQPAEAQPAEPTTAVQWDGTASGATPVINWILNAGGTATYTCTDPDRCATTDGDTPHYISIRTPDGAVRAHLGDWIVCTRDGHLSVRRMAEGAES